ncbi:hypothetical protein COOONC_17508 [Cooperia oncophora]
MVVIAGSRESVNASFTDGMPEVVSYHTVNATLGALGTAVNMLLLVIFVASASMRKKSEVLIVLCLADGMNTLSILLMGLNRVFLYKEVRLHAFALKPLSVSASQILHKMEIKENE